MILIFTDKTDYNVKCVTEWLHFWEEKFIVIHRNSSKLKILGIKLGTNFRFIFKTNNQIINSSEIKSIWFRNGVIDLDNYLSFAISREMIDTPINALKYYLSAHNYSLREYVLHWFQHHPNIIGFHSLSRFNKLIALSTAEKIGLKVPSTIVTCFKKDLINFTLIYEKCICKSLDVNFEYFCFSNNKRWYEYTKLVTKEFLAQIPEEFSPSLIQEYIAKKYELRVFFIKDNLFSSLIHSQSNLQTQIDYRRYDTKNMNRILPFNLPKSVENKIKNLMKELNLTTGSIDLIIDNDKNYIFLEINPVGQYGYNSSLSGYNLHKVIAANLINKL